MSLNSPLKSIRSAISSLLSKRPERAASSFSFMTRTSEWPASLAPTQHPIPSTVDRSSTVQGSIYSQDPERAPLLPTFTTTTNARGEVELISHGEQTWVPQYQSRAPEDKTKLKYRGEQIWEPQHQSRVAGGQRKEEKHQRGCVTPRADIEDQARWKRRVQDILGHDFLDVDLLEEALESPGSRVVTAGERRFLDGNRGLARVGEAVMTLVLRDQCYLYCRTEDETKAELKRLIDDVNLYLVGKNTKLQQYIRPHAPIRPSENRRIMKNIGHEFKTLGSDPVRTIANGMRALIGAVYFDSGYEAARRIMVRLDLIIKLPEESLYGVHIW